MVITSRTEKSPYRYKNKAGKDIVEDRWKVIFVYEKADGTAERIKVPIQKTKSDAIDKLRQLNKEHTKKGTTIEHRALLFRDYAADYKEEKLADLRTADGESNKVDLMIEFFTAGKIYTKEIKGYDNLTLEKLRREQIKKFKLFLQKTKHLRTKKVFNKKTKKFEIQDASKARSPRTVNTYLERLRALLREAETDEKILSAPSFKGIIDKDKEVIRKKIITYADFERVLAACDVVKSNHDRKHLKLPLIGLYELGCRVSELQKILVKDIDLESRIVMVWEGKRKSPIQRPCYISDRLHDLLVESGVMEKCAEAQAFGEQKYYARSWRTAKKIAGVDMDLRINDERHSNITYKNQSGMDLVAVQKGVGHSAKSAMTLDVYTNLQPDYIRDAHQKFDDYSREQRKQAEISELLSRVEKNLVSDAVN